MSLTLTDQILRKIMSRGPHIRKHAGPASLVLAGLDKAGIQYEPYRTHQLKIGHGRYIGHYGHPTTGSRPGSYLKVVLAASGQTVREFYNMGDAIKFYQNPVLP